MSLGRVFVTRRIPETGIRRMVELGARVEVWPGAGDALPARAAILGGACRADVLVSLLTERIDGEILSSNPGLRGVANYAVGTDNIDLDAATLAGIPVSNTPDVLTDSTADLTWALLLAAARHVAAGDAMVRAGRYRAWAPQLLLGEDISRGGDGRRKTLGIVGFGRIGQAVARRAVGFDLHVIAHDPGHRDRIAAATNVEPVGFERLLEAADFVTLHVPLTARTRHLIDARALVRMKATAVLVNTSRGAVIDEAALVEALRSQRITAAGLDVYEHEPELQAGLTALDNVVLLPHLGSASRATRERMAELAADNALAMLQGLPAPHCVNPSVYTSPAYRARIMASRREPGGSAANSWQREDA